MPIELPSCSGGVSSTSSSTSPSASPEPTEKRLLLPPFSLVSPVQCDFKSCVPLWICLLIIQALKFLLILFKFIICFIKFIWFYQVLLILSSSPFKF
ncbi:hypothetical protein NPIL_559301 [Nephila pilipes]|uniref:Uncharacterized protein n=1 Tax=Nephila pilipes TaxID=299642 RepID=A0A8X6MAI1_NEPPI|nr:hypothetical protein NPIL_559301 [Nephila pilipes]